MSVHVKVILFACFTSYVASFNAQGIYKSIKTDYVVEQEAVISNVDFKIKLKDSKPKVSSPLRFTNQQKPTGDSYETYKPNWDDLDKRPLPTWYDEAKIGIFIHWGVFSVPSFRSEWFWWDWQGAKYNNTVDFMKKNYRPGFTYADFAPKFTAEFFNADQWADIFNTSGARLVLIVHSYHRKFIVISYIHHMHNSFVSLPFALFLCTLNLIAKMYILSLNLYDTCTCTSYYIDTLCKPWFCTLYHIE